MDGREPLVVCSKQCLHNEDDRSLVSKHDTASAVHDLTVANSSSSSSSSTRCCRKSSSSGSRSKASGVSISNHSGRNSDNQCGCSNATLDWNLYFGASGPAVSTTIQSVRHQQVCQCHCLPSTSEKTLLPPGHRRSRISGHRLCVRVLGNNGCRRRHHSHVVR